MVVDDFGSSSFHLSIDLLRAFMKKFPTVVGSRPSCLAMVTCISFEGLFVSWKTQAGLGGQGSEQIWCVCVHSVLSRRKRETREGRKHPGASRERHVTLKIACRVRRWRSVKTNRGFLGVGSWSELFEFSSFRLQPDGKVRK